MTKRRFLRDSIIIFSVTAALLVAIELALRAIYPEKIQASHLSEPAAYEFSENFLISLKPNVTKDFSRHKLNGGYVSRWWTNNNSFRGPALAKEPPFRIIVYGDSNVQARFSGIVRTFPAQTARYLRELGIPGVEVINAGVVGFGPDQSLIRLKKDAAIYNPDLIIFHIFADNDFGDIIRNRLFELDGTGNLVRTPFEASPEPMLANYQRDKISCFYPIYW